MPFTTLNDEEEKELWRLANRVVGEPLLDLSFERHQVALTKWGPCGPISEGHGFQAAHGAHAYRQRQPLSLCTRDIDPNVGGLGHARLQRTLSAIPRLDGIPEIVAAPTRTLPR